MNNKQPPTSEHRAVTPSERKPWYQSPLVWIMAGLGAWGLYLAVGGYLHGGQRAVWQAALILGCTLFFLFFWGLMLAVRSRRNDNRS